MPYPTSIPERAGGVMLLLGVAAAGVWVLADPPQSYEGLGAALVTAWGALLAAGGGAAALGWAARSYKLELPAMVLIMGGLAVYSFLSWGQTLTVSPGSGPRALLISAGAIIALLRAAQLIRVSRSARWAAEVRTG